MGKKPGTPKRLPKRWTSLDHALYDCRIRQGMGWREVGAEVGMSFSGARTRFYARMAQVTPAEVEAMRAEENLKYDERERHLTILMAQAIERLNLEAAISAVRALDAISKSRRQLNGLNVSPEENIPDSGRLNELMSAYLAGIADGNRRAAAIETTGEPQETP